MNTCTSEDAIQLALSKNIVEAQELVGSRLDRVWCYLET